MAPLILYVNVIREIKFFNVKILEIIIALRIDFLRAHEKGSDCTNMDNSGKVLNNHWPNRNISSFTYKGNGFALSV